MSQEIAPRLYHSLEVVDQHLRTFDQLLVLGYFGFPKKLMVQVIGHGLSLMEKHLAIAVKHLPTTGVATQCLISRGVGLEEAG